MNTHIEEIPYGARSEKTTFRRMLLGLVGLQFVAAWPVNILPMVNGALIDHRKFSPLLTGMMASIELLCFSVALIVLPRFASRFRSRSIGIVGLLLATGGNLLTALTDDPLPMMALRAGAGFGAGLAALGATTAIARSASVGRLTTALSLTTATLVALGVFAAGFVIDAAGADGLFLFLALVPLAALISAIFLNDRASKVTATPPRFGLALSSGPTMASISSLFGAAVVWSFAERIGVSIGLGVSAVGAMIALLSLAGIVGGIAAVACAHYGRERMWAIAGVLMIGLWSVILPLTTSNLFYGVAIGGQAFFFVFLNPFLLALACREDPSGAVAARMLGLTSLAAAFAPSLAGALLDAGRLAYLAIAPAICTPFAIYMLLRPARTDGAASVWGATPEPTRP